MSLTKYLRKNGYDLIDGPIRNHKLLQLWLKTMFDDVELYFSEIDEAFVSDVKLKKIKNDALNINSDMKNEFSFNLGLSLLEDTLEALNLGNFNLNMGINKGKKVTISYEDSQTVEVPIGDIENYLSTCDFKYKNKRLLKNANRNNILIISGVLMAKKLNVSIETDSEIKADVVTQLKAAANGKIHIDSKSNKVIQMTANTDKYFPIAVKANRIDFDKGVFDRLNLITDNRTLF
ncbi:hypothetical protein EMN47_09970 [Prolixibacteraceae bacterium JC049]|nr:hypothetical protein [Prolixibacteraceae bacterium JC049]